MADEAALREALRIAEAAALRLDQAAAQLRDCSGQTAIAGREAVSVKEHLEKRCDDCRKHIDTMFSMKDTVVEATRARLDERLHTNNQVLELARSLAEHAATKNEVNILREGMVMRPEYESKHSELETRLGTIQDAANVARGRASIAGFASIVTAAIAVAALIADLVMRVEP